MELNILVHKNTTIYNSSYMTFARVFTTILVINNLKCHKTVNSE